MSAVETVNQLTPVERDECLALLRSAEVGRLAVGDGGQPLVFPVNFAMAGESPVFRTAPGTKLQAEGRRVCFEVDEVDLAPLVDSVTTPSRPRRRGRTRRRAAVSA